MAGWGWRVPFLLGLLILPVGLYLRTNVEDSESFTQRVATQQPIRDAIRGYGRLIAIGFGITIARTVCTYCLLIFMPTYAIRELGIPAAQALTSNGLGIGAVVVFALIGGALSDRVGLRWPMAVGALAIAASVYFLFANLAANPSLQRLIVVQVMLGAMVGLYTGPAPTLVATMFPVEVRSSGFSLAYNFAVTIFGGFAPFISTWLVGFTGSKLAVTYYVLAAVLVSLVSLACLDVGSEAGIGSRKTNGIIWPFFRTFRADRACTRGLDRGDTWTHVHGAQQRARFVALLHPACLQREQSRHQSVFTGAMLEVF